MSSDNINLLDQVLTATGHGNLVPLVASLATVGTSLVGAASVLATVYPPTWKGAATIHKIALLVGKAAPATPASTPPSS
jgi:hypothetical protein